MTGYIGTEKYKGVQVPDAEAFDFAVSHLDDLVTESEKDSLVNIALYDAELQEALFAYAKLLIPKAKGKARKELVEHYFSDGEFERGEIDA